MSYDRMHVYDSGRFHDMDLPDWYHEPAGTKAPQQRCHPFADPRRDHRLSSVHPLTMTEGRSGGQVSGRTSSGVRCQFSIGATNSSVRSRVGCQLRASHSKVVGPVLRMPSRHSDTRRSVAPLSMVR